MAHFLFITVNSAFSQHLGAPELILNWLASLYVSQFVDYEGDWNESPNIEGGWQLPVWFKCAAAAWDCIATDGQYTQSYVCGSLVHMLKWVCEARCKGSEATVL